MANQVLMPPTASMGRGPSPIVWGLIPRMDLQERPGRGCGFFDDFVNGVSAAAGGTTLVGTGGQWIATAITSGTIVDGATDGGVVTLTPAAADNQGIQVQTTPSFTPAANKRLAFGARVMITDPTQVDLDVGLAIADTDVAQSLPASYAVFNLADGAADLLAKISRASSAESTDTTSNIAAATWYRLEAYVDELNSISWYVDGVRQGAVSTTAAKIPNVACAMTIACVNGATAAQACAVDWAYCYQWYKDF